MKNLFSFCAMAVAVLSLGLSSCTKEDPAKPLEVDLNRTGTVEGTILYINDQTTTPQKYAAPSALEISATIPYSALNTGASGTYSIPKSNITYSGGKFTVKVPVGVNGADVTISVSSFAGTRKQTVVVEGTPTNTDVNGIWSLSANIYANVQQDQTTLLSFRTLAFTPSKVAGNDVD